MTTQPETAMVERVSRLEGAYDQVNERLGDLTQAMTNLHNKVHEVETRLNAKIDRLRIEMHRQTLLVVGLLGGLMALFRFLG